MATDRERIFCDSGLAVRCARAEMERDAAREKVLELEARIQEMWRAQTALMGKDKEAMLDTIHIMGIPARDFAELYEVEMAYRRRQAEAS